jgi:hypothetical protein
VDRTNTLLHTPIAPSTPARSATRRRILGDPAPTGPPAGEPQLVLGRYRLLERLGAGGFGEVWRARDELLHREVAVKRVRLGPDGHSERVAREAHASARLSHPAIVALYEACAVQDAFYLISELVHGATLARLIAEDALTDEEILEIGVALVGALAHAHARGVIHRDIKPQNVLVPDRVEDPAGAAKLTDFGGASLMDEDALTRTGDVLGTLAYMAPEQSAGEEAGEEADLYALALVLYEALSGINPVRGATPAATARRIGCRLEPLERRRRDLPRALTRAIDAALLPSPRERGTLEQLRDGLQCERAPRARLAPRPPGTHHPTLKPRRPEGLQTVRPSVAAAAVADATPGEATAPAPAGSGRLIALPRMVWLGCALALVVWQAWAGRPGVALLLLAALLPLLALPRRSGPWWLGCASAPALGLAGLAGVFPALAGQARRWPRRAALGALGFWWMALAEPLLARHLWLGPHAGTPARAAWEGSLGSSAAHVVGPLLSLGVALGAALWALGAVLLPWLVRGSNAALDIVAATVWSAAMVAFAPALGAGLSAHAVHANPRGAVLGGILGGVFAVAARALRGPV